MALNLPIINNEKSEDTSTFAILFNFLEWITCLGFCFHL